MNYYVIVISTGDSKIAGPSVYGYATEREAVATFHQKLSSAMKSDLYESELILVIDTSGKVIKREKYTAETAAEAK